METVDWHRLFGATVDDLFSDLPFNVKRDVPLQRQFPNVVVLRRKAGEIGQDLPDGLDNLAEHNLITYKSMRETLDDDAIDEFVAYSFDYRKHGAPSGELLPLEAISMYAICTEPPPNLHPALNLRPLDPAKPGVYELRVGHVPIRVIVLSEIRATAANRLWNIFSAREETIYSGVRTFQFKNPQASAILDRLFAYYRMEGVTEPYSLDQFIKDTLPDFLAKIPHEERLKGISPEDLVKSLSVEQLEQLKALLAQDTEKRPRDE